MKKKLLILALFGSIITMPRICCAQWFYGTSFDSLSSGMTSPGVYVLSLAMKDSSQNSHLYAGGHFAIAGRKSAINIAEWIDTVFSQGGPQIGKWEPLGTGTDSDVFALAMFGKYLYAGGKFDSAGGILCTHIARWDTALLRWDSLVGKLNGNVYALCVFSNKLYAGGDFTIANGDTVNRIAVWNDSAWAPVGKGFDTGAVYALTVSNDTLYAGGSFLKSGNLAVNHIAKLSGNKWDSLGGGTNNTVYALSDYTMGQELMVGGAFTKSGNVNTRYLSYFEEYAQSWNGFTPGVNDTVRALNAGWGLWGETVRKTGQGIGGGDIVLVGGNFDSAGYYSSHYIAGIIGNTLDTVGMLNGPVYALANPYNSLFASGDNYVGGKFSFAENRFSFNGGTAVNNVAYLYILLGGGIQSLSNNGSISVYPNPSTGQFNFSIASGVQPQSQITLEIYTVLGEMVYRSQSINHSSFSIDLNSQPNGVYFYRLVNTDEGLIGEGKLVIGK